MNCDEARQHWNLYHDSEGDPETCFEINEHLGQCPECAEWFHRQSRLEDLIESQLRNSPGPTAELWAGVLGRAGLQKRPASMRGWLFLGSVVAMAATVLLAVALGLWSPGEAGSDLSRITAHHHKQFTEGNWSLEFESGSDLEVEAYLRERVSFPVRCPPRKDTGFLVRGAGVCQLDSSEAAYVVGDVDGDSVSIFILPRRSLARFPHQQHALLRERTHRCREGAYEMVMRELDQSVIVVIGQTSPERLQRVLKGYGTYPHVRHI